MTGFPAICEAMAARCQPAAPDVKFVGQFLRNPPLPGAMCMVEPGRYGEPKRIGTLWILKIQFCVPSQDEIAAWQRMGELTDLEGPVATRLKDLEKEIDDEFAALTTAVQPTVLRGWTYRGAAHRRHVRSDMGVQLIAR